MYNLDIELNEAQRQAVEDTEGQILVLAGAGSGKTRVLTARIAYLVKQCGVAPYEILAITFTNKAAKEMLNRIEDVLDGRTDVWASTFHSFCAKILRYNATAIGYTSSFTIYDEQDSSRVIKRLCAARGITDAKIKDKIADAIFQAKCFSLRPAAFRQDYAAMNDIDTICEVYEAYEEELKASNALDFDDLLLKTVELFMTCPDILKKYQQRFRYINVDEFQDTNTTQYTLVRLLAGIHGNIFVVGDEDQSIYSWRGAEIKNILNFKKDFKDAKIYTLEQNYRSTNAILKAANRIIAENRQRIGEKNLWTENAGGDPVNVCNVSSDRDEADFVVREIANLIRQGYNNTDIAILSRINALTRPFEERLNLYGIPYKVYGGFKFYERKEVKDVIAYLRIAANPRDNEAILRVINFPKRGIGDAPVSELLDYCADRHEDLIDALLGVEGNAALSAATRRKLSPFRDIVSDLIRNAAGMSLTEFVKRVLTVSGIEAYYKTAKEEEADRYENILELVNAVRDFERDNGGAGIDDFLQSVTLISETDSIQDDDFITLATVHAVKGLEFPIVFIIAAEEGIFPLQRAVENSELEEERRLMYVAITRAKRKLYVTSAQRRFRFNTVMYNVRSRFVGEMTGKPPQPAKQQQLERPQPHALPKPTYAPNTQTAKETVQGKVIIADFSGFVTGKKVIHKKFGTGTVVQTFGEGVDKSALIHFEGIGTKKFLLLIANLQLVD